MAEPKNEKRKQEPQQKEKSDCKKRKAGKMANPRITRSKEHRGCGPLGYYLRLRVSKRTRNGLCGITRAQLLSIGFNAFGELNHETPE